MQTHSPLKASLLAANRQTTIFRGRRYRLDCEETLDKAWRVPRFRCVVQNLTPKTPDEAKFCIWDLWQSDTLETARLINKFEKIGKQLIENPKAL